MKQPLKCFVYLLILGVILSVSETVAQDTSPKTLIVIGATVNATVIQVEGRSYVDIEGLAQALSGSVTFDPSRIKLTIPAPAVARVPQDSAEMSNQFQQMAVVTLAEMREWRRAISECGKFLSWMIVSGAFSDDPSCH